MTSLNIEYNIEDDIPVVREADLAYPRKMDLGDSLLMEGDALHILTCLPDESVQTVVTSPPYWGLRDYGIHGQIGLEAALPQYLNRLVAIFNEARRVLKNDGILWLNIGDGYTSGNRGWRAPDKKNPARAMSVRPDTPEGLKPKDLIGVPWRLAFALQEDGWYLRSDIIWNKPNAMPESVKDRPTRSHEYIFMLTKSEKYYYDYEAAREMSCGKPRNRRTVWDVKTLPFPDAHFATFPPALIEPCIMSSSLPGDFVLDPFLGFSTVGVVCRQTRRKFLGIELNPEYLAIARRRINQTDYVVRYPAFDHPADHAQDRLLPAGERIQPLAQRVRGRGEGENGYFENYLEVAISEPGPIVHSGGV